MAQRCRWSEVKAMGAVADHLTVIQHLHNPALRQTSLHSAGVKDGTQNHKVEIH